MSIEDVLATLAEGNAKTDMRYDMSGDMAFQAALPEPEPLVVRSGGKGSKGNVTQGSHDKGGPKGTFVGAPPGSRLGAFLQSIATQESGGSYKAKGIITSGGDRAYGKYQIMGGNFLGPGGWDKEALGRDVTLAGYMNHPKMQERIARHKLTYYFKKYGATGAAKSWYAGESNHDTNSDGSQYGGPSINDYAAEVRNRMLRILKQRK